MSSRSLIANESIVSYSEDPWQLAQLRCLPVGPFGSSACAIPCTSAESCDGGKLPASPPLDVTFTQGQAFCDSHSFYFDKPVPCTTQPKSDLRCTRHAVRHHCTSSCHRSHPAHGTCHGTLRCLLEDQPPYCDAPEPGPAGCVGITPPPAPPPPCVINPETWGNDWGLWDHGLTPCPAWTATNPPCGADHPPCANGQLCVPLHHGRRCLSVYAEYKHFGGATKRSPDHGCWPDMPSSSTAGGDFFMLPGTLPDANTPSDVLQAYDFRLDWQAARGIPCRDDHDCKIPVTSPFGKTVWLQGATRCAEQHPGAGGYCLKACDIPTHGLCHEGTACGQGPGGWRWCLPFDGGWPPRCSPLAVALREEFGAGQRPCSIANPFGVCAGVAACAVVGAVPACDAKVPAPEVCGDGVDQDCDGLTDEGCGP